MSNDHYLTQSKGIKELLLALSLKALAEITPLYASIIDYQPQRGPSYQADAAIELHSEDKTFRYLVECKTKVDRRAVLDQINERQRRMVEPLLLVTDYLSRDLANHCRSIGLQFIDTHGNAFLRVPGLFVFVAGEKRQTTHHFSKPAKGLTGQAALRVVLALLTQPELLRAPFKEIANWAGVAAGSAYNVVDDLEQRGYVSNSKSGRRVLERDRLIDEWIANYPTALRTKLNSRRFRPQDPFWWERFALDPKQASWGAEVAAAKMLTHLKPSTQTIYVAPAAMSEVIDALVKLARLRPDPYGSVELLERFWSPAIEIEPGLAPPLVVYSDLLAMLEPRAKNTASLIWEKYYGSANHST
ncbi:type IV toxin-antitoxin system AbiEi family antitoxin [Duganella sp.]|uniref:type IV toxin-antitoxin system AbiEi family antitoxin n=1 Tax=Duganella sp. TaxID=1904440 RepID=UPI0031D9C202